MSRSLFPTQNSVFIISFSSLVFTLLHGCEKKIQNEGRCRVVIRIMNKKKRRQVSFLTNRRGQDKSGKADSGEGNQYRPLEPEGLAHREGQIVSRPPSSFITSNCLTLLHFLKSPSAEMQYSFQVSNLCLPDFDDVLEHNVTHNFQQSLQCHRKCQGLELTIQ